MGKSHTTDWHPGRVSKEYTKRYKEIAWNKDCNPGHCGMNCHNCPKGKAYLSFEKPITGCTIELS